jgi:hypothetical protein
LVEAYAKAQVVSVRAGEEATPGPTEALEDSINLSKAKRKLWRTSFIIPSKKASSQGAINLTSQDD